MFPDNLTRAEARARAALIATETYAVHVDLSGREVRVVINLRNGRAAATVWTNDLTYDYVKENAEYST